MIDYSPLWKTMKKRSISQYALRKNQNVTVLTIEKLCDILDCTPNDVFSFKKEAD